MEFNEVIEKLTQEERDHLIENKIKTIADLDRTFEHQAWLRRMEPRAGEPCYHCRDIAEKLGYL